MADSGQSSSQTPDTNIAMLAKSVTTLQKLFQQICDALSDKLGNDSDDFSDKEGCISDFDGRRVRSPSCTCRVISVTYWHSRGYPTRSLAL